MSTTRVLVPVVGAVLVAGSILGIRQAMGDDSCSSTVREPVTAQQSVDDADPGDTICLAGDGFADVDLAVSASGEAGSPLTVRGTESAVLRSVVITGRHVVLDGFTVRDGAGISCDGCDDSVIASNTVTGADGTGISFAGSRIEVRDNRISGSRMRTATDADGIRFFGAGHLITGNLIEDISAVGYPGPPPHPDCFQTFDSGSKATTDIVIRDNVCRRVAHQCLIATAEQAGTLGIVGRSHAIEFTGNICEVGGSQAVLVRWFPGVDVRDNLISGPGLQWGGYFSDGSSGSAFSGNRLGGDFTPFAVDESSRPGFDGGDNQRN